MDDLRATGDKTGDLRRHLVVLAILFAVTAAVRISGPENLLQGDQDKQVGYVMDILRNGNWVTQYEVNGMIATKPPFYNWCAALACRATRSTQAAVMKLPSLGAAAGLVVLLYLLGRKLLDPEAAFWAAVAAICSHHVMKLMWFARTDMLMTFTLYAAIALTVLVRAYWWRAFAIGAILGISILTKGPVGPALYVTWLLVWAAANGRLRDRRGWIQVAAGAATAALIGGWWLWAVWDMPGFRSTVIDGELGSRFQVAGRRAKPFWYYLPLVIGRIAPWSLIAIAGARLGWAREREPWGRTILVWALAFLTFFSVLPAKRHDLLLPVYPAIMLLAGIGMREILRRVPSRWLWRSTATIGVALGVGAVALASRTGGRPAWGLAALAALAAAAGLILAHRGRWQGAFLATALALVFVVGLESWKDDDESWAYRRLNTMLLPMVDEARAGRVVVVGAHPLVSFLLGLHEHDPHLPAAGREPIWLLSGSAKSPEYFAGTGWVTSSVTVEKDEELGSISLYIYALAPDIPGR